MSAPPPAAMKDAGSKRGTVVGILLAVFALFTIKYGIDGIRIFREQLRMDREVGMDVGTQFDRMRELLDKIGEHQNAGSLPTLPSRTKLHLYLVWSVFYLGSAIAAAIASIGFFAKKHWVIPLLGFCLAMTPLLHIAAGLIFGAVFFRAWFAVLVPYMILGSALYTARKRERILA